MNPEGKTGLKRFLNSSGLNQNKVPLTPMPFGWLNCSNTEMQFLDFDFKTLGRIVFDPDLEGELPANPRWIGSDGSLLRNCSRKGLSIMYMDSADRLVTESLERFTESNPHVTIPTIDALPFRLEASP